MILSGKEVAQCTVEKIEKLSGRFESRFGRPPVLAVVLVGNNPASCTYVKSKCKLCDKTGIRHLDFNLEADSSQNQLIELIEKLDNDDCIDGILVQLPLPKEFDTCAVINSIDPSKDVDGFTIENTGKLMLGIDGLVPCTPKGILRLIDYYNIKTESKNICVIGRSNIVGKPVAALLQQKSRNATVTICNSYTKNLKEKVSFADIVICATGHPMTVTSDMVKDGATVIDVGITRVEDPSKKCGYHLCGDVDFEGLKDKTFAITPVPGGVGPMTVAMLMENTLDAACRRKGISMEEL